MFSISYPTKKFFGKFVYRISLSVQGQSPNRWITKKDNCYDPDIKTWIANHMANLEHKVRYRYNHSTKCYLAMIYLSDSQAKDQLISQFSKHIEEVCQPLNQDHEHNLEPKNMIEVRKTLIYKKYKYVTYFKYDRSRKIRQWLQQEFKEQLENNQAKLIGSSVWNTMYFANLEDMVMVKMMCPESIHMIKTVMLFSEQV
jgi:hypothetical protein